MSNSREMESLKRKPSDDENDYYPKIRKIDAADDEDAEETIFNAPSYFSFLTLENIHSCIVNTDNITNAVKAIHRRLNELYPESFPVEIILSETNQRIAERTLMIDLYLRFRTNYETLKNISSENLKTYFPRAQENIIVGNAFEKGHFNLSRLSQISDHALGDLCGILDIPRMNYSAMSDETLYNLMLERQDASFHSLLLAQLPLNRVFQFEGFIRSYQQQSNSPPQVKQAPESDSTFNQNDTEDFLESNPEPEFPFSSLDEFADPYREQDDSLFPVLQPSPGELNQLEPLISPHESQEGEECKQDTDEEPLAPDLEDSLNLNNINKDLEYIKYKNLVLFPKQLSDHHSQQHQHRVTKKI